MKQRRVPRREREESSSESSDSGASDSGVQDVRRRIRKPRKTRRDNSLSILTEKFIQMLESSPEHVVDLNDAVSSLEVEKRRIYDITNVLEGIGYIKKFKKSQFRLISQDSEGAYEGSIEVLEKEIAEADRMFEEYSNQLQALQQELEVLVNSGYDSEQAYIRESDLKDLMISNNSIFPCFIFGANMKTVVDVYHPKIEPGKVSDDPPGYQIIIKSSTPLNPFYAYYQE